MIASRLDEALSGLSIRGASSVVARGRVASPALNAVLLRRLSARPGEKGALLADPVFEAARAWETADCSLGDLAGRLLHPDLVAALDEAEEERMPRDLRPWSHQLAAWEAASEGLSCLVSSGTGSGKTECFMIPMLDDLLRDPAKGALIGVRAIVIYPLNALIESQRERLAAWTEPLSHRFRFALYNGLTPETPRQEDWDRLATAEIGNRRDIREAPPAILVTNVTMLEYLLLRAQDRPILERSRGLLRWIVLDEAHSYIGAQAAEMALLLRRVRAAFGVEPDQVRLMATSATIGAGDGTEAKLKRFVSDLAGLENSRVQVIQGRTVDPELPRAGCGYTAAAEGPQRTGSRHTLGTSRVPSTRSETQTQNVGAGRDPLGRGEDSVRLGRRHPESRNPGCARYGGPGAAYGDGGPAIALAGAHLSSRARRILGLYRFILRIPGSGTNRREFGLEIRRGLADAARQM